MSNIDSNQFNVNQNAYSGPLDVLLDLAKSQKVNLENISVTKLADQFHEFIIKAKDLNLEIASEYLLMATWLTYLKSKLLLPESDEEEFKILEVAEKLKLEYAELDLESQEWYADMDVDLNELNMWEEWEFSKLYLSKIVTARYEEILYFVKEELKKIWKDWMLPEWAIFVWGWSKIKWFLNLSKKVLKLPSFMWGPSSNDELNDTTINDPVFAWAVWTLILANRYSASNSRISINLTQIFGSIVKIFKKLLP